MGNAYQYSFTDSGLPLVTSHGPDGESGFLLIDNYVGLSDTTPPEPVDLQAEITNQLTSGTLPSDVTYPPGSSPADGGFSQGDTFQVIHNGFVHNYRIENNELQFVTSTEIPDSSVAFADAVRAYIDAGNPAADFAALFPEGSFTSGDFSPSVPQTFPHNGSFYEYSISPEGQTQLV